MFTALLILTATPETSGFVETINTILSYKIGDISVKKMLWAVLVLIVLSVAIKLIFRFAKKGIEKANVSKTVKHLILTTVKVILYFIAALIAAEAAGIPVSSLLAMFSVVGLAVSLAAKDLLTTLISGLVVLFTRPFNEGDYIDIADKSGTVDKIDLMYTTLVTPGNNTIKIPNSKVSISEITNYTRLEKRRIDLVIGVDYSADSEKVRESLLKAASLVKGVDANEEKTVFLSGFASSNVEYTLRVFCKSGEYLNVKYALNEQIKKTFDTDGIVFSYEHRVIHLEK